MNPAEYQRMFEIEEHYWWYIGMRQITLQMLGRATHNELETKTLLDAGCGTGGMLNRLRQVACALGLDLSEEALRLSIEREMPHAHFTQGSITRLPLQANSFDIVISFDVVSAVREPDRAVQEFYRVLKPGGVLLVSVPAYEFLRSQHDTAVFCYQRYTIPALRERLMRAGFTMERITYANTLLFPFAVPVRLLRRNKKLPPEQATTDLAPLPRPINSLLAQIFLLEARWLKHFILPFGLTVIALARK